MDINSKEITNLLEVIENVRRRKIVDERYSDIIYIDPLEYVTKLKAQNNHIISGRRGCGKTTIMLASMNNRENYRYISIDCQIYRKNDPDTIIIKFLLKILEIVKENLVEKKSNISMLSKLGEEAKELNNFIQIIDNVIENLLELKNMPNSLDYKVKTNEKYSEEKENRQIKDLEWQINLIGKLKTINTKVNFLNEIVLNRSIRSEVIKESSNEYIKHTEKSSLIDELIEGIGEILTEHKKITKKEIGLYLDDFYQISLNNQTRIIQYFHDVFKNCENKSFCFKICTLPNRIKINYDGENILSLKDDFSTINLDRNLSDLEESKDYLLQIISSLEKNLNITPKDIESLFTNKGVLLNLIIGSGGIPRDFLIMFAEVVSIVRANNENKIGKTIIYSVVNSMREDKDKNIEYDSDITQLMISSAIEEIEKEIVSNKNTNVFLFSHNQDEKKISLMRNLVNLRYFHIIKENTSSENRKKEMFTAYLVDMSFYVKGKQKKRGFNERPFWEKDERSRLKHIESAPIFKFKN